MIRGAAGAVQILPVPSAVMTKSTYKVPTISCDHCKQTIEKALGSVAGVDSVTVDVDSRTVEVIGDLTSDAVPDALSKAGYPVA